MSEKLRQHRAFLNLLATASVKQRRVLMKTLSIKQLKTLLEVIYNVIHNRGILPSDSFIKNLYNYWHLLHRLAKKKGKDKKKNSVTSASRLSSRTFKTFTSGTRQICQLDLW